MDPLTIIGLLAQFAPSIVKLVGGGKNVQDVATQAATIAKQVTGTSDITTAAAALNANPELAAKFQSEMLAQETEFERMYTDDKANARARDIALSSTPSGNVRANWLVGVAICTIIGCLFIVVRNKELGEYVQSTISLILGMFLSELKNIYNFEFGTTRRSREKSTMLKD